MKKKGGCLKTILTVFGVIIVLGVVGSAIGGKNDKSKTETVSSDIVDTNASKATDTADQAEAEPEEDDSIPAEYKSALRSAENYSKAMHMSKNGIYDQLTSEYGDKFSAEAAQYAVDNMSADWNANALASAENYSNTMHMSKAGIYDQLTSDSGEKFTSEEAQYAIDNVQADWNANALASAKNYQNSMAMSPEAIRDQLSSEYGDKFTQEEADYAVANLN